VYNIGYLLANKKFYRNVGLYSKNCKTTSEESKAEARTKRMKFQLKLLTSLANLTRKLRGNVFGMATNS